MVSIVDGVVQDQIIRVADLAVTNNVVSNLEFRNCRLIGPAVVAILNGGDLVECVFDGPLDAILWDIPEDSFKIGAIGFDRCRFFACRFDGIGFASVPQFAEMMRASIAGKVGA